jgi:hypothetical protein
MENKKGLRTNMFKGRTYVNPVTMAYYVTQMPYHKENKQTILDMIADVPRNFQTQTPEEDNYQRITKYDFLLVNPEHNRPWVDFVKPKIIDVLRGMPNSLFWSNPVVQALWFQQYEQNDTHDWHPHAGANWAGIYYLEAPEKEHITQFVEPFTNNIYAFNAQEGDIVFFPAQIFHRSAINSTNQRKTVIAFNFDLLNDDMYELNKE